MRTPLVRNVVSAGLLAATLALGAMAGLGQEAQSHAAERVKIGDVAPDFALTGSDGRSHHLGELRGEKRVVLVIFRGAW